MTMALGQCYHTSCLMGRKSPLRLSRTLNESEKKILSKEALACVAGVTRFHSYLYLYGRQFTLQTDHKPLMT